MTNNQDVIDLMNEVTNLKQLVMHIQAALNTEETGEALIEVARNAHRAEMELASLQDDLWQQSVERDLLT